MGRKEADMLLPIVDLLPTDGRPAPIVVLCPTGLFVAVPQPHHRHHSARRPMSHRLSSSHLNVMSQNNEKPTVATIPNIDDSFRVRLDGSLGGGAPISGSSFEGSLVVARSMVVAKGF
ncbi:hypothetical protein E3N88_00073 [Mikania micrantha]|uniref:Uncharacterized protein n=1 Tax=Mikania micrantha TaxID=192012 RepID=A0A5N6PYH2_9ASTR|nr:hypothetical protein E3N88_00073 [Mikania micrantha]